MVKLSPCRGKLQRGWPDLGCRSGNLLDLELLSERHSKADFSAGKALGGRWETLLDGRSGKLRPCEAHAGLVPKFARRGGLAIPG